MAKRKTAAEKKVAEPKAKQVKKPLVQAEEKRVEYKGVKGFYVKDRIYRLLPSRSKELLKEGLIKAL